MILCIFTIQFASVLPQPAYLIYIADTKQQQNKMLRDQGESNECLAITLFSITQIVFPASYIYISQQNFSLAESNLVMGIVLLFICVVTTKLKGIDLQNSIRRHFSIFFVRNMSALFFMYALLLCHFYLSISIIHTINTLGTIFVFIWDYYLYGITINFKQFLGIICGVTGIILTVNSTQIYLIFDPDFVIGSSFSNNHAESSLQSLLFAIFLIVALIVGAYSACLIKTVKMKDSSEMNFHYAILMIISSGIHYCIVEVPSKRLQVYVGALFFTAFPFGFMQILFVKSLNLSKNTGALSLFQSVTIIVGYCISLIRYNQNLNPIAVSGSLLIVTGLPIVVLCKDKPLFRLAQHDYVYLLLKLKFSNQLKFLVSERDSTSQRNFFKYEDLPTLQKNINSLSNRIKETLQTPNYQLNWFKNNAKVSKNV